MRKGFVGSGIALLLALGLAAPVLAQRITGNVVGTVKDDTGAILPGVTVVLSGEKVVGKQTATTNEQGFYRFGNLPPGTYDLVFTLSGFGTLNRPGIKVSVGATEEVGASLKVSADGRGDHRGRRDPGGRHPDQLGQHELRQGLGAQRPRAPLQHVRPARRRPGGVPEHPGLHDHVGFRLGDRRELVPDRRHQPDLVLHGGGLALSQHRRHRGDRGAGPGRAGGIRQRHGGGLQRGHPPGHERLSRRRQLLLPEPGPDRPQHDGPGGMRRRR